MGRQKKREIDVGTVYRVVQGAWQSAAAAAAAAVVPQGT